MNHMKHIKNKLDIFLRGGGDHKSIKDMTGSELADYFKHNMDQLSFENDMNSEWLKRHAELEKDAFDYKKSFLYPHLSDPNFNEKIAKKR